MSKEFEMLRTVAIWCALVLGICIYSAIVIDRHLRLLTDGMVTLF